MKTEEQSISLTGIVPERSKYYFFVFLSSIGLTVLFLFFIVFIYPLDGVYLLYYCILSVALSWWFFYKRPIRKALQLSTIESTSCEVEDILTFPPVILEALSLNPKKEVKKELLNSIQIWTEIVKFDAKKKNYIYNYVSTFETIFLFVHFLEIQMAIEYFVIKNGSFIPRNLAAGALREEIEESGLVKEYVEAFWDHPVNIGRSAWDKVEVLEDSFSKSEVLAKLKCKDEIEEIIAQELRLRIHSSLVSLLQEHSEANTGKDILGLISSYIELKKGLYLGLDYKIEDGVLLQKIGLHSLSIVAHVMTHCSKNQQFIFEKASRATFEAC